MTDEDDDGCGGCAWLIFVAVPCFVFWWELLFGGG